MSFERQVRSSLDEMLSRAGLPWNSVGPGDEPDVRTVLYCGPADEYLARFPHLAGVGWTGDVSCVDVAVSGNPSRIRSVEVEGEPLVRLLRRAAEHAAAARVESTLRVGTLAEQLDLVRESLAALYE